MVFEILSDTSWHRDMFVKSQEYQALAAVQQYVILSQRAVAGWVVTKPDWRAEPLAGPGAIIVLDSIGISVPLAELYQGLRLQPDQDEPD